MEVRWDDQSQYPEVTIESFAGQSSMSPLCPPSFSTKLAVRSKVRDCHLYPNTFSLESRCTYTHTHTHTHTHILADRSSRGMPFARLHMFILIV